MMPRCQVPTSLGQELEEGSLVTLRGQGEDGVVLCTQGDTYAVKGGQYTLTPISVLNLYIIDGVCVCLSVTVYQVKPEWPLWGGLMALMPAKGWHQTSQLLRFLGFSS